MNRLAAPIRHRFHQPAVAMPTIAATFNLEDPAERQIFDIIQRFYDPKEADIFHALKRGVSNGQRVVWTLGSFQPHRRGAKTEWSVITWNIDQIEMRSQRYPSQNAASAAFAALR